MSVIPLILEGPGRTVVQSEEEFQAAGGLDGSAALIQSADLDQLNSPSDSNVTYDLRVGAEYKDHRDDGKNDLSANGKIEIPPGGTVIIQTEELIHLPKSMFGHIVPKVSLLQMGISNTSSKVDPGYNGRLLITTFNLGKRTLELYRGKPFCCLYLLKFLPGARPYAKPYKQITGKVKGVWWRNFADMLERRIALITIILIVATLINSFAHLIPLLEKLYSPPQHTGQQMSPPQVPVDERPR